MTEAAGGRTLDFLEALPVNAADLNVLVSEPLQASRERIRDLELVILLLASALS